MNDDDDDDVEYDDDDDDFIKQDGSKDNPGKDGPRPDRIDIKNDIKRGFYIVLNERIPIPHTNPTKPYPYDVGLVEAPDDAILLKRIRAILDAKGQNTNEVKSNLTLIL